jgi:hypothetical protein
MQRRPAEQTGQESQARFARPGAEGREPVGADVRRKAALAGVARPGVVDGDERRADEPGPQYGLVLGAEPVQFGGISLFGFESGAALATVVGVLIEVPVMLSVVWIVDRSKDWYGRPLAQSA